MHHHRTSRLGRLARRRSRWSISIRRLRSWRIAIPRISALHIACWVALVVRALFGVDTSCLALLASDEAAAEEEDGGNEEEDERGPCEAEGIGADMSVPAVVVESVTGFDEDSAAMRLVREWK